MTELSNVAMACKQLYDDAEAARNLEELEQAAKRFGERLGAVGLRILVTVAMGKLAGKLPSISKASAGGGSGTWTGLGAPRFTLNRLVTVGGWPVVQTTGGAVSTVVGGAARAETVVANGTILLMGALVGAEASAAKQVIQTARTTGGCRPDRDNGKAPEHPEDYHMEVFRRLQAALGTCRSTAECKTSLLDALDALASDICKPGSDLNRLVKKHDPLK